VGEISRTLLHSRLSSRPCLRTHSSWSQVGSKPRSRNQEACPAIVVKKPFIKGALRLGKRNKTCQNSCLVTVLEGFRSEELEMEQQGIPSCIACLKNSMTDQQARDEFDHTLNKSCCLLNPSIERRSHHKLCAWSLPTAKNVLPGYYQGTLWWPLEIPPLCHLLRRGTQQ